MPSPGIAVIVGLRCALRQPTNARATLAYMTTAPSGTSLCGLHIDFYWHLPIWTGM